MKFTENPRRWRKVLMYIALSKLPEETFVEEEDRPWQDDALTHGVLFSTVVGAVIAGLPVTVILVLAQWLFVMMLRVSLSEGLSIIGGATSFGAFMGWFSGSICFWYATSRYSRLTMLLATETYLQAVLIGAGTMVGSLFLIWQGLEALGALSLAFETVISFKLPGIVCFWALFPTIWVVVTCWHFRRVLIRFGECQAPALPPAIAMTPAPRGRILFRRGKSVARALPVQGGTVHTHPLPPRW